MPYRDDLPSCFSSAPLGSDFNDLHAFYQTPKGSESGSSPSGKSWVTECSDFLRNPSQLASVRKDTELRPLFKKAPLEQLQRAKPQPARQRTAQACDKCRERKTKCSGHRPICLRCTARGLTCEYSVRETKIRVPARTRNNVVREGTPQFEYADNIMPTPAYRSRLGGGRTNAFAPSSHPYSRPQTEFETKELDQDESPIPSPSPLPLRLPISYTSRSIYPMPVSYNQASFGTGLSSAVLDAPLPYNSPTYILRNGQASHQPSYPSRICATQAEYSGAPHTGSAALPVQISVCRQADFEMPR
ncbi:hypothetical protein CPB84DRAFT_1077449 [Gymnopilus junonius]|uniref:Zn(2)-C6 fungal-type domain-containing protein n=1 Tax=Gymnopilus junonius TaxID=109634 RepID=A0A9P5TTL2_GYMJU|nr:hypothetical protein CPB84DRAFT_1077449 [Gymnopilus junonius]